MYDKIYFVIPNYFPEKKLGIRPEFSQRRISQTTGEVWEKPLFKIPGFNLSYSELTNSTVVNGSVRKFYFGNDSLKDFTYMDEYKEALNNLSELLKISYGRLLKNIIYKIEIGKNFNVNMNCDSIISSAKELSSLIPIPRGCTYKRFEGKVYDLVLYNKLNEILDKNSPERRELIRERHTNENHLRIELRLKKKVAINQKLYGYVNTLYDSLAFFDFLPFVLIREIEDMKFNESQLNTIKAFEGKSLKEFENYLFAIGIHNYGLDNCLKTAKDLLGVEKSYYIRNKLKASANLVKLKKSSVYSELLSLFEEQLNATNEHLETIDIASEEYCFDTSYFKKII